MKKMGNILCSRCKVNPAEVFMSTMLSGKRVDETLCLECALKTEELSMIMNKDENLRDLLEQALQTKNMDTGNVKMKRQPRVKKTASILDLPEDCPMCGMGIEYIYEHGMAGCSHCYSVFEKEIDQLLELKRNDFYKGKKPEGMDKVPEDAGKKLKRLKDHLKESIRNEEYERAGSLKAEISRLENSDKNI